MKAYTHLSQIYDLGWGDFSRQYVGVINGLLGERGITQARILDLACGTGILAIELAHLGHYVHGVDSSPEMIDAARSKSSPLPNAFFEVADMTEFQAQSEFDLVTCTFDSINYLMSTDAVREMLRRVASALNPGGLFVFDSNTKKLYRSYHDERQERVVGGQSFVQVCTYDPMRNEAMINFTFPDGSREIHRQHPYGLKELRPLLSAAGMGILRTFSWFDGKPRTTTSEKLFFVAQKR